MTAASFQPGDRVRARVSTPLVQAGTPGTVTMAYSTMRDAYEVRFDGQHAAILMRADELERVDDTPEAV